MTTRQLVGSSCLSTRSSARCSVMTQQRGTGGGKGVQEGEDKIYRELIHIVAQQKLTHTTL